MVDPITDPLQGRRLLIVEDDYMIASDLAFKLERMGAKVVGPACCVRDALDLLQREDGRLDGAVLDINLNGEQVFPVADTLLAAKIPFIFATGYDRSVIPERYSQVPRYDKPADTLMLARALNAEFADRVDR